MQNARSAARGMKKPLVGVPGNATGRRRRRGTCQIPDPDFSQIVQADRDEIGHCVIRQQHRPIAKTCGALAIIVGKVRNRRAIRIVVRTMMRTTAAGRGAGIRLIPRARRTHAVYGARQEGEDQKDVETSLHFDILIPSPAAVKANVHQHPCRGFQLRAPSPARSPLLV